MTPLIKQNHVPVRLAAAVLLSLSSACSNTPVPTAEPRPAAEILWDTWGVPHVYADGRESVAFAFGWSQAAGHGDLLLRLYGESRGRAAEYWGPRHLAADGWVWRLGIPERSARWMDELKPEFRAMTEAFARGVNAYAAAHPDKIAPDVKAVLPVVPQDVLNHFQRVIHFTFIAPMPGMVDRLPPAGPIPGPVSSTNGSNAWAIAPRRTAEGHAILLANPHLPWDGLYTWHEAHLVAPGLDLYGATLVGFPFLSIAFNENLGWTHTVNTLDGADLYIVEPAEGGYRYGGKTRGFTERRYTLKVREEAGGFREEELAVMDTVHGPVVGERGGQPLALRVVGLDAPHVLEQYWGMGTAKNLEEFEAAHALLQMPLFTTIYADREGHILHLFSGRIPERPSGDWGLWSAPVSGSTPDTLWTSTHDYAGLPRIADPPTGWLQNANDPPWTTTVPLAIRPDDFPPYFAPRWGGPSVQLRAQRSSKLLMESGSTMSFEQVVAAKHSTRVELADRVMDELSSAVEAHGDGDAREAMAVLAAWDRQTNADSRGAVLFLHFIRRLGLGFFAEPWSADKPLATPDGLSDPAEAARVLSQSAREMKQLHGSLDIPWGDVNRFRFGDMDLPANGGPGAIGIFRNVEYRPDPDRRTRAIGGDSFVMVVQFTSPIRAQALLPYGNATQPHSPHRGDQFELMAAKKLRDVWRARGQVEANLEAREAWEQLPD